MLHLRLLGGALLEEDKAPVTGPVSRRHPLALLSLLAIAPGCTVARGKLVALLWPEAGEHTGRNRLNTYVHQVRSALGGDVLASVGDDLRLNPDALSCDVWDFEEALHAGNPADAVAVYRGPLLDGLYLPDSVAFEQRISRERDRLRRAYQGALEALAEQAERRGDVRTAADRWRELAGETPYDSRVVHRLMQVLASAGNRAAALRAADEHARLLAAEIGTEPSADVQALAERLRIPGQPHRTAYSDGAAPSSGSIAVLPFESLTDSDEARVFAEGLHADLVTELSRFSALTVISRSSVLHYRGKPKSLREVARELGVQAVVEGAVQQAGRRMRMQVQLIDADRGVCLWADRYDRDLSPEDLFALQSDLTREIAQALETELTDAEQDRLKRLPTANLDAYRLYVRGRTRLEPRTEADLKAAVRLFRSAIDQDEAYAAAWAGLADALGLLVSYFHVAGGSALADALTAARRAVELDPELAEGYAALGLVHMDRKEGPAAVRALKRAIGLSPSYAQAHSMLGFVSACLGRHEEAWSHLQSAERLNPMMPEIQVGMGYGHMLVGYPAEKALHHARRARELAPGYAVAYLVEGHILTASGHPEEGARAAQRGLDRASPASRKRHLASLIYAWQCSGARAQARRALAELEALDDGFFLGTAYAVLGAIDEAFAVMNGVDWTGHHAFHLGCDPALELLRADPRYRPLVRKVNRSWGLEPDGSFPES